jgi:hypothetical protein
METNGYFGVTSTVEITILFSPTFLGGFHF